MILEATIIVIQILAYHDNSSDHINSIKGKTEAAYQTILNLLHDKTFAQIQMKTVWKLLETCVIPVITYASETWNPTKKEMKQLNKILDDIIKRILMTPISTPREALYIETNLLDIERIIDKRKINTYYRITRNPTSLTQYVTQTTEKTEWLKDIEKTAAKYEINLHRLTNMTNNIAKKHIRKTVHRKFRQILFENQDQKSKINYLTEGYLRHEKAKYTDELNRQDVSLIFKTRNRMLEIKDNYRNKYENLTCRLCKQNEETQKHILEECDEIKKEKLQIHKYTLFSRSKYIQQDNAEKIRKIVKKLQDN